MTSLDLIILVCSVAYFYIFRRAIDELTQWEKIRDEVKRD